MKREAILGIDAGTSSVKVCAFSLDGFLIHKVRKPVAIISWKEGYAEIDVLNYWSLVKQAIKETTQRSDISIISIGLSTTCPTTVVMDKHLNPLRYGITYLDNRAAGQIKRFSRHFESEERYVAITGNRMAVSTCSVANLLWIQENEEECWNKISYVGMLNSFLAGQLTGNMAVDWTQASYSGIFSLHDPIRWNKDLINLARIPENILLDIAAPYERIGSVSAGISRETGLPERIPVAIGSADTAAAAFAIGFKDPNTAFESVGTSGVLTFLLEKPIFDPIFMNRCHVLPDRWLSHGAISMMGGALDWLRHNVWDEYDSPKELDSLIENAKPGANGVVFLPYLSGERCPIWNPEAVGVWYGLTLQTKKIDLIESVYESGAFALRQIFEYAKKNLSCNIDSVIAVGEGTRSDQWNQIKSDVLDVVYRPTHYSDAAAFGAALMGGIAAGVYSGIEDKKLPILDLSSRVFKQREAYIMEAYSRSYRVFTLLYPALKDVMSVKSDGFVKSQN